MTQFFAHTSPDGQLETGQHLEDHLNGVAERARAFAAEFGAEDWGRLAGLWHDLGKFSKAFQDYLRAANDADSHVSETSQRVDHSTAGAQHAVAKFDILGHLLAYAITGHHSGLLDHTADGASFDKRLAKRIEPLPPVSEKAGFGSEPAVPPFLGKAMASGDGFAISFFTRMVFSCLVDADFLDTEAFMDPERAASRPRWPDNTIEILEKQLDDLMKNMEMPDNQVNRERSQVRETCLEAAREKPGLFSLTVPTGGGKTLSSLAFALRHALAHGMRRVIYVIPFTSIIEQNAEVFRNVTAPLGEELGEDPVLEHHSNVDVGRETAASRLASENWDSPLVVTTSVQFYESLFSNRSSRCRKLHNLARSVIILDEAQTIPVQYLEPCLKVLDELARNYGSTVVLCTATQPAVRRRDNFSIGLEKVREIVPEPVGLYQRLKRVRVDDVGTLSDDQLARRLLEEERVLCIVNTRNHARSVYEELGAENGHYHLSALMCPAHRSVVLGKILRRVSRGERCRVVSTQLVEAGVDVDFPAVYRSLAGIDSIAQAAGRCNRNGLLTELGRTYVFRSEHQAAERYFAETGRCASQVLELHRDPLSLEAVERYFKLYYWEQSSKWDGKNVISSFRISNDRKLPFQFKFAQVARDFRLIEDSGQAVIVPWGERGRRLCDELRRSYGLPGRRLLRSLQRFTVQVPKGIWSRQVGRSIELVHDRYAVLSSPEMNYSEDLGLSLDEGEAVFLEG